MRERGVGERGECVRERIRAREREREREREVEEGEGEGRLGLRNTVQSKAYKRREGIQLQ